MAMSMTKFANILVEGALFGEVTFLSTFVADVDRFVATATATSRILAFLAKFLCPHDFHLRVDRFEKSC